MMGAVAYMARLAGNDQSWIVVFMAGYGLAVWTAGYLKRGITSRISTFPFWIILGLSYFILGQIQGPMFYTVVVLFIKDLAFWIIFHRISSHIQMDTPAFRMGSVMSARNCIMTAILAGGEVLVGAWSNVVSISFESWMRGLFGLSVGLFLYSIKFKRNTVQDRPIL